MNNHTHTVPTTNHTTTPTTTMTNKSATLYKLDANHTLREWTATIEPPASNGPYILKIKHGVNGGKPIFETILHLSEKSALDDLKTRYNKQVDRKGYTTTIPLTRPFRPMLLHKYDHSPLPERVFVQPKLNGMRCMASSTWMKSRENLHISCLPHIQQALSRFPPEIVLDGELYCHGKTLQEVISLTKRIEPHPDHYKITFFVFDLIDEGYDYSTRLSILRELLGPESIPGSNHSNHSMISLLETLDIPSSDLENHHNFYLRNGFEGTIIRKPAGFYYMNVRTNDVLKYKPTQRGNFQIMDIVPGDVAKDQGVFIVRSFNNTRSKATPKFPHHMRAEFLKNKAKYIGRLVEVEYEDTSSDHILLKAIAIKIH